MGNAYRVQQELNSPLQRSLPL